MSCCVILFFVFLLSYFYFHVFICHVFSSFYHFFLSLYFLYRRVLLLLLFIIITIIFVFVLLFVCLFQVQFGPTVPRIGPGKARPAVPPARTPNCLGLLSFPSRVRDLAPGDISFLSFFLACGGRQVTYFDLSFISRGPFPLGLFGFCMRKIHFGLSSFPRHLLLHGSRSIFCFLPSCTRGVHQGPLAFPCSLPYGATPRPSASSLAHVSLLFSWPITLLPLFPSSVSHVEQHGLLLVSFPTSKAIPPAMLHLTPRSPRA